MTELEQLEKEIEELQIKKEKLKEELKEKLQLEKEKRWKEVRSAYDHYQTLYTKYKKDFNDDDNENYYDVIKNLFDF